MEKTWPWLRNPATGNRLRLDLYLPTLRLGLEYDGRQHRERAFSKSAEALLKIQARDAAKGRLLARHRIGIIRISDWPIDLPSLIEKIGSWDVSERRFAPVAIQQTFF